MPKPACGVMPRLARWMMLGLILHASIGCGAGGKHRGVETAGLPKLSDLASTHGSTGAESFAHKITAVASVVRIWLPAGISAESLWQDMSLHALSDVELEQWRANELTAAVVNRVDVPAFLQKLHAHYGVRQQMITLAYELAPLGAASTRRSHQPVGLLLGGQPQQVLGGGQWQFLIAADVQSGDWVKLTLLPHLYQPRQTLLPRPHTEAALDGRIFNELMLRALLSPGKVLLVAAHLPVESFDDTPPEAWQPASSQPGNSGDSQPSMNSIPQADRLSATTQPVEQELEIPPVSQSADKPPASLGRTLLTSTIGRAPVQQIILIEVQKVEQPTTQAARPEPSTHAASPASAD